MERHLQVTADGSHTLSIPAMQVTYHSKHGAIQESSHVFINAGLDYYTQLHKGQSVQVLEMGFGTGLNCLLTAIYARIHEVPVQYHSLEAFPLSPEEVKKLNYGNILNESELFEQIHQADWNQSVMLHQGFHLHKHHTTMQQFAKNQVFNCIFFDAFAPAAQPELWTETIFASLFSCLAPGGLLVTYCSKGNVRRTMEASGFRVTKIPGPPGKREMVRAFKDS